ncbi:hypothetical protein [Sporosarcina sp. A2]|uniref:hypothetical protein n=1 Tax=Sporosarcina sp. A2 TaxID=3393449 RepID=UPI003D7BF55A
MNYKVINTFKEKHDNDRVYKAGDPYPADGFKPTKNRIEELSVKHPEYDVVFIKEDKLKEEKVKKNKKKE